MLRHGHLPLPTPPIIARLPLAVFKCYALSGSRPTTDFTVHFPQLRTLTSLAQKDWVCSI